MEQIPKKSVGTINEQKRGKEATRAFRLETIRALLLIICYLPISWP